MKYIGVPWGMWALFFVRAIAEDEGTGDVAALLPAKPRKALRES